METTSGHPHDAPKPSTGEPLWRLVYSSSAIAEFDEASLRELAAKAADRNRTVGLSGTLLFRSAVFLQVLEGPRRVVDALARVIEKDTRHAWMTRLVYREIGHRMYENWGMDLAMDLTSRADWLAQDLQFIARFTNQLSAMDPDLTTTALLKYFEDTGERERIRRSA